MANCEYLCKVCYAPCRDGEISHGKGCYQISEDGGGVEECINLDQHPPSIDPPKNLDLDEVKQLAIENFGQAVDKVIIERIPAAAQPGYYGPQKYHKVISVIFITGDYWSFDALKIFRDELDHNFFIKPEIQQEKLRITDSGSNVIIGNGSVSYKIKLEIDMGLEDE